MNLIIKTASLVLSTLLFSTSSQAASFTAVPLPTLNSDLHVWTSGAIYDPIFPGTQSFSGVPFTLQSDEAGRDVFVGKGALELDVNLYGVDAVYTLINSANGTQGENVGSISFIGSTGETYSVDLIEGINVRDHYYGRYVNTVSANYVTTAVFGTNTAGTSHLDMQKFVLPDSFRTQTLNKIIFNSLGDINKGNAFLAGLTAHQYTMTDYIDISSAPDLDNDGQADQSLLVQKNDSYFLRLFSTASGKTLKNISLGTTSYQAIESVKDLDNDGTGDEILIYAKNGKLYLRAINLLNNKSIYQVQLGSDLTLTALDYSDNRISLLLKVTSTKRSQWQLRDATTGALIKRTTLAE